VADARAAGVDLDRYDCMRIAADVDAPGYRRLVYCGASHGAQLGQNVKRDFPAMLEAVILDGANSLSPKSWVEHRVRAADSLQVDPGASRYALAYGRSMLEAYIEFCDAVDAPPLPDSTDVDVATDVPTLMPAGRLDARTPAVKRAIIAPAPPRAMLIVFP
jgi:pimeloyl-ACP methyl ester carboxylesterase